ncbi:hypothetical protein BC834DRAFT_880818 [Gloeopeniophorella convolvens]|nr:hypothetical protein BC834DRAFT_880818 [Gloeopeniophorella convolvens]
MRTGAAARVIALANQRDVHARCAAAYAQRRQVGDRHRSPCSSRGTTCARSSPPPSTHAKLTPRRTCCASRDTSGARAPPAGGALRSCC